MTEATGGHAGRALFAGLTTLDIVQSVERPPGSNEKVAALDFLVVAGGPAANAAVAFAHCGGAPLLVTALPEHALTAPVLADLAACGVEVHTAASYDGPPVTASIMVTRATGDRAIVSPSGVATQANPEPTDLPSLEGIGAVLVDGYFRAISLPLAAAARERGIPVIADIGSHKAHTDEVAAACDIAVVSDDYAPPGTDGTPDAVVAHLESLGVSRVVITRGGSGVLWAARGALGEVEVSPVPVADTLGAGDFFHGAFTHRIATLGLDDARLADDIAYASRVAGASLGSFGTRAWLAHGPAA